MNYDTTRDACVTFWDKSVNNSSMNSLAKGIFKWNAEAYSPTDKQYIFLSAGTENIVKII